MEIELAKERCTICIYLHSSQPSLFFIYQLPSRTPVMDTGKVTLFKGWRVYLTWWSSWARSLNHHKWLPEYKQYNVSFIFKPRSIRIGKTSLAYFCKHLVCYSTIIHGKGEYVVLWRGNKEPKCFSLSLSRIFTNMVLMT